MAEKRTRTGSRAAARKASSEEEAFIAAYRRSAKKYPKPSVAVDLVVFTILDADMKVLLIRRKEPPFRDRWALPGGFVRVGDAYEDQGESLESAAERELHEETGLPRGSLFLEQLHAFGDVGRDPRMRVISIAYYALVRSDLAAFVRAGSDAADARWWSLAQVDRRSMAFDHPTIIDVALARIRDKIEGSNIAFELVPETFTIAELRAVHEVIKGEGYDPGNFRRRFHRMIDDGVIERAPGKRVTASKPAAVYRFRAETGAAAPPRRRGRPRKKG